MASSLALPLAVGGRVCGTGAYMAPTIAYSATPSRCMSWNTASA